MNLLAHLHLGQDLPPLAQAGNLMADYHRKEEWPDEYQQGVEHHRLIDGTTDAHPAFREACALFEGPHRRFAGILVDLGFDYCLSHAWDDYEKTDRTDFIRAHLADIEAIADQLPPTASMVFPRLHRQQWLEGYVKIEGLGNAIRGIAKRRPVAEAILGAESDIESKIPELKRCFSAFYPDLQRTARPSTTSSS